jgi:ABC-2 type transport system ATP-binding protein
VNLFVKPEPNAISEIQNMLAAVDINVFSLSQSRPSLDDVFLAATGQTILDAEIAQSEILTSTKGKKKKK